MCSLDTSVRGRENAAFYLLNVVGQVPDGLWGVDGVSVGAVHDARVVEHYVDAAPGVEVGGRGGDVRLFRDVAFECLEALVVGDHFLDFGEGFGEGGLGDVGHEDGGAFAREEDGCFEADAAGERVLVWVFGMGAEKWGTELDEKVDTRWKFGRMEESMLSWLISTFRGIL